jgi:hypothetical protein
MVRNFHLKAQFFSDFLLGIFRFFGQFWLDLAAKTPKNHLFRGWYFFVG